MSSPEVDKQIQALELVSKQVREQGDVQQVLLEADGVSQTFSLADELWIIAYNLRSALAEQTVTTPPLADDTTDEES